MMTVDMDVNVPRTLADRVARLAARDDQRARAVTDVLQAVVQFFESTDGSAADRMRVAIATASETPTSAPTATAALTAAEREQLIAAGSFTADELAALEAQVADGALDRIITRTRTAANLRTVGAADLTTRFGWSPTRISRRAGSERTLVAFSVGRQRRFPEWQFTATGPIPHLADVIHAIPDGLDPVTLDGIMTTPQHALRRGDGTPQTPVEWLSGGGSVDRVEQLFLAFERR